MVSMRTAVFLTSLRGLFLVYDVMLRVRLGLGPRSAFAFMSSFQRAAARRVLSLARVYCDFRLRVTRFPGLLPRRCLLASNHQSLVDIPVLMHAFPELDLRFVAKRELRRWVPGVSMTLRSAQHALIGRKAGFAAANRALRGLARLSDLGVSPVVFPEGTRSKDGSVQRFHAAAVRVLSEAAPLPILSVAVEGGYRVSRLKGLVRNLRGTSYRVAPLTLYPPARTRAELNETLARSREEISATIRSWREEEMNRQPAARGRRDETGRRHRAR